IKTLEELGLPITLRSFIEKTRGMVLVTGPTGSGKSTTLAALVDIINNERSAHLITLEDPIEFLHHHKKSIVNQREIGTDSKSFADALRAALREDPDVILVGEMRDLETISTAISAAETGHLVLATLHTNDTVQTVDRIIDMFPPHQQQQIRVQLAATLVGVVSQQLVPRMNGVGRVVACEVLVAIPAVRNLIREGKTHQIYSILQTGAKYGMQSLDSCLRDLYARRLISLSEALMRASDPEEFKRLANVV
ncbi:MAG: PilT/PilU family type 4a pilus ATPase, partial [Firmicutes bacterium]|nr:PilT/PilU family type 4a pilus ATPase [Bacillota bacterium]